MSEELKQELESIAKFAASKAGKFNEQAFGDSRVEDAANVLEDIALMLRNNLAALGSRGVQEEEPQEEARCQACNSPTFWVRDRFVCPTCGHENGTAKLVAAALRGVGTPQEKEPPHWLLMKLRNALDAARRTLQVDHPVRDHVEAAILDIDFYETATGKTEEESPAGTPHQEEKAPK